MGRKSAEDSNAGDNIEKREHEDSEEIRVKDINVEVMMHENGESLINNKGGGPGTEEG